MNKILVGSLLGAALGIPDGLSALISASDDAAIRQGIVGIVVGSTIKGGVVGFLTGLFAQRVRSLKAGILFGLLISLFFAGAVAALQGKYYAEIMIPGGILGAIVGYATQIAGSDSKKQQ